MKKGNTVIPIAVLFILVLVCLVGGYYFYNDYKGKIGDLEQQSQNVNDKLQGVERNLDGFAVKMDNLSGQFRKYSEELKTMEEKSGLSATEKTDLLAKIDNMVKEVESLKEFSAVVNDLKAKVDNIKATVEVKKDSAQKVDLGKISVNKPNTAVTQ